MLYTKDTPKTKWFQKIRNHKEVGVVIVISYKVEFSLKSIKCDKDFIILETMIHNENRTVTNICAPNNTNTIFI